MKKKFISLYSLLCAILLASCSSEEAVQSGNVIDASKGITFQFSEEGFQPGVFDKGTRAAMKPQVMDLGNGLEAEISLDPDTTDAPKTRAGGMPISDGKYKIYAVDDQGHRHDGLEGTITNGKFTPTSTTPWHLEVGKKYTFVCFTVYNYTTTDNGASGFQLDAGDNQMIGVTEHTVVDNNGRDAVPFVMKHQTARMKVQITSYTAPMMNGKCSFSTDGQPVYRQMFDVKGNFLNNDTGPWVGMFNSEFSTTQNYTPSDKTITYKNLSNGATYFGDGSYVTIISGIDDAFNWDDNSTLYGKKLKDIFKIIQEKWNGNLGPIFQKNYSYIWNFKIRPKYIYLFSDGTVGTLGDKGSRIPIGVVIKEKFTDSDKGTAIALKDASTGPVDFSTPKGGPSELLLEPTATESEQNMSPSDEEGYKWTWETIGKAGNIIKANDKRNYTPYYVAGHYNPGVSISGDNIGKWYLPTYQEWLNSFVVLSKTSKQDMLNSTAVIPGNIYFDINIANKAFIDANGEAFATSNAGLYWSSSEMRGSYADYMIASYSLYYPSSIDHHPTTIPKRSMNANVRSFVHF